MRIRRSAGLSAAVAAAVVMVSGVSVSAAHAADEESSWAVAATYAVPGTSAGRLDLDDATGRLFVGAGWGSDVYTLDAATGTVLSTVSASPKPIAQPSNAWQPFIGFNRYTNRLWSANPSWNTYAPDAKGLPITGFSPDGRSRITVTGANDTVSSVAVNPSTNTIWATGQGVNRVDGNSGVAIVLASPGGSNQNGIAVDETTGYAFVAEGAGKAISVYSPTQAAGTGPIGTIPLTGPAGYLVIDQVNHLGYVLNMGTQKIETFTLSPTGFVLAHQSIESGFTAPEAVAPQIHSLLTWSGNGKMSIVDQAATGLPVRQTIDLGTNYSWGSVYSAKLNAFFISTAAGVKVLKLSK